MSLAIKSRDVLAPQLTVIQNKLKGSKADHVLPALTFLDTCLRNVSALMKKRGKKKAACRKPDLSLSLSIQCAANREHLSALSTECTRTQ